MFSSCCTTDSSTTDQFHKRSHSPFTRTLRRQQTDAMISSTLLRKRHHKAISRPISFQFQHQCKERRPVWTTDEWLSSENRRQESSVSFKVFEQEHSHAVDQFDGLQLWSWHIDGGVLMAPLLRPQSINLNSVRKSRGQEKTTRKNKHSEQTACHWWVGAWPRRNNSSREETDHMAYFCVQS